MSWFDAGALANIAKSALKEAQKTIDKALDIKEDGENNVPVLTPIDTNSDDFFGTWGISQSGNVSNIKDEVSNEIGKQNRMSSSYWGSFTGSFFVDNTTPKESHSHSIESLDDSVDSGNEKDFSKSKLVVQHSEEERSREDEQGKNIEYKKTEDAVLDTLVEISLNEKPESVEPSEATHITVSTTKQAEKEKCTEKQPSTNRLSIISLESNKNNSESIDVLTGGTECATTPESDVWSFGLSTSTSSSAQGLKQTSESIEVLGDSLTSPSSVEIISSDSINSRRHSQYTDEFVSPLDSPQIDTKLSTSTDKLSPESVEVIPEEQDEKSGAEDTMSYTSISESTSATVLDTAFNIHIKPQKMLKDTYNRPEFSETISSDTGSLSPDRSFSVGEAITRAPGRSMHLPLQQVSHNQILIDTQPQSSNKQDLPKILETTNVIDIPQEDDTLKSSGSETQLDTSTEDGSISDKTLVETQENVESGSDTTSTTTETSSNSTYLKNMLADAMVEKSAIKKNPGILVELSDKDSSIDSIATSSQIEIVHGETSPISSEKSDLVKIGSDHTSGHTSCDELETTTSSDIEIISSPNGDSSSTQSRQSPAKRTNSKGNHDESAIDSLLHKMTIKKAKGHNRELSEASSISDDSHTNGDIDRLLRRISEMTEILESRETKLIDMNRRNAELQEQNSDLKNQLDCVLTQQLESADLSQVTEEYTQRLSALEKKFQQAIREKDSLRKQLEKAKLDVETRMSKNELESAIAEKDELIKELREEGEKLAKQHLHHSNIIKKLRAKEKEHETTIKNLKETNESLTIETDRLKKSLSAKEDVERTQIEAVHNLTTKNKKLESEVAKLKSQLDDLTQKYDTTKKSLEAAKVEVADKTRTSSELLARQQMLESLEKEKRMTESQNEEVISQLDDLRYQLRQSEEDHIKKEQKLKQENSEILRRLEEAENRNEELSQSVMEISRPLVRQLESLQSTHNMKVSAFEKIEQELTLKISDLRSKLQASASLERSTREECVSLRSKLADLEGQLNSAQHEVEMGKMQLEQLKTEKQISEQELKSKIDLLQDTIKKQNETLQATEKEIQNLRQQLAMEKISSGTEKNQQSSSQSLQESMQNDSPTIVDRSSPIAGSNSPTLSLGKVSASESLSGSFWSQDEPFEVSHTPRYTNMFEMQMLQSNLKQREGELQQLQWELNRREQERSLLNSEISALINRVEELEAITKEHEKLKVEFISVQQQYETLCQLYGEKVEENEELKLDLVDVKKMYKSQIDELLRQQREKYP